VTRFDAASSIESRCGVASTRRDLFYGGSWQAPQGGYVDTLNPGTGESLGPVAEADPTDVDAAVRAAHQGFRSWRNVAPLDRGRMLRQIAAEIRKHGSELALLDAANCGNPVTAMLRDAEDGADTIDYFAGLVTELKGAVTPMGPGVLNMRATIRCAHAFSRTITRRCSR
jgi:betaine-aldehyde dehydrogenase